MSTESTTGTDPDVLRARIEDTRRELGSDVDALADKVTPGKIMHRQTDKVKSAVGSVTDRLMGSAGDAGRSVNEATGEASDLAHHAVARAKGNPLAVGLIAFGVGWLASSLIPASTAEKRVASQVKDAAQPLVHEAAEAAKQVGENLKQPLADAADAVTGTATDAAETVKTEASSSASEVRDEATHAAGSAQG